MTDIRTNPVGTKENRQRFRKMTIQIAESAFTGNETLAALDGLDIAEEMADMLKRQCCTVEIDGEGKATHEPNCSLAKWDKWKGER